MTQPAKANEPTMEEILASIRRIIADDDTTKPPPKAAELVPPPPPHPMVHYQQVRDSWIGVRTPDGR